MTESLKRRPLRLSRIYSDAPLYFVTFCTHVRKPLLACEVVHQAFRSAAERINAAGNAVGRYVIMPDHIHVFLRIGIDGRLSLAVKCLRESITKRLRQDQAAMPVWQPGFFDHLMRSRESYAEKWAYVKENPVRAGLIKQAEEWSYQGEIVEIRW